MKRSREQLAEDHPRGCRTFWALDQRIRDKRVSIEARGLWRIIDSYANRFGEGAFPSILKLADIMGRDRKAIFRYIKELESAEWLAHAHGKGKSNCYVVIYPIKPLLKVVPKLSTSGSPQIGNTIPYHISKENGSANIVQERA